MTAETIQRWLLGDDTGISSKALAGAALGIMPRYQRTHPGDGGDFGRCHRLMQLAPEMVQAGLDRLGKEGGPYWSALVPRWADITAVYLNEIAQPAAARGQTYKLMRSILDPVEMADRGVVRLGNGASVSFGR